MHPIAILNILLNKVYIQVPLKKYIIHIMQKTKLKLSLIH